MIEETIETWAREHDRPLPLPAASLANLVAIVYHGMETHLLADGGRDLRGHRELLATIGDAIERFESA